MSNGKTAVERKNEILDAATRLFYEKGYEATSVNDIMNSVGIAKGTLYYHFKSKEEIMNAMIERITNMLIARARMAAADKSQTIPVRVFMTFGALNVQELDGMELLNLMHKPQNILIHQRQREMLERELVPILTELVEEGIKEGVFETEYPRESVEMILIYADIAFDDMNETEPEATQKRIQAFIYNLNRIFQTKNEDFNLLYQLF